MNRKIDAVIIDTSAYHENQCDFEGVTNSIIPMLLQLLAENNITLLTHPVLEGEIKKHIVESNLVTRVGNLQTSLKKYKRHLEMIGVSAEQLIDQLNELDMATRLNKSFDLFYQRATTIPFVDAEEIFGDYFKALPPFNQTGNKKSEFPDAFILKGIVRYLEHNPDSTILVVSNDSDWKGTLKGHEQIVLRDSLGEAMILLWEQLDDKSYLYQMLISELDAEIRSEIKREALIEAFSIDGIYDAEEVEVQAISVIDIAEETIPLEVTSNSVLLQITVTLSADGYSEFLDENRSIWDKEDSCYYFCVFTRLDFKNALADVDCEIRINFSVDGSLSEIELVSTKLVNKWDISLSLDEAVTEETDITDYGEDDYYYDDEDRALVF